MSKNIENLQVQHREMLNKYKEMEQKLLQSQIQLDAQSKLIEEQSHTNRTTLSPTRAATEKDEESVEQAFDKQQLMQYGDDHLTVGVRKIQELLLSLLLTRLIS